MVRKILKVIYPEDLQCPICENYKKLNALGICPDCQDKLQSCRIDLSGMYEGFDKLTAAYLYNGTAQKLVNRHKLGYERNLSKIFAKIILEKLKFADIYCDSITWVPCTKTKKIYKGFDHAEDIAVELGKLIGISARPLLIKHKDSGAQKNRTRDERFSSMEDAFVCEGTVSVGEHILIVDDVITTGATMQSAANALYNRCPNLRLSGIATFYTPNDVR